MRLLVMAHTHFCSIGGVNMPKSKPTQVIVHRIELQEKEREMLDAFATTQALKNAGIAVAAVGGARHRASLASVVSRRGAGEAGGQGRQLAHRARVAARRRRPV